jgi:hypothetical protein
MNGKEYTKWMLTVICELSLAVAGGGLVAYSVISGAAWLGALPDSKDTSIVIGVFVGFLAFVGISRLLLKFRKSSRFSKISQS